MDPDRRREQIVRVAAEHFSRVGFGRAAMTQIAADAGVTRALVYHYFPGKESVLEAVLQREADALLAATAPDPELEPGANLVRALEAYLDHFTRSEGAVRELYSPHPTSPAMVWVIAATNHDLQIGRLLEMLGEPKSPPLELALGAWLAFVETAAREHGGSGVGRDDLVRLCLGALQVTTGIAVEIAGASPQPSAVEETRRSTTKEKS